MTNYKTGGVYDFVIIGAGFFGLNIAKYLESKITNSKILVVEKEENKLMRASRWNQSRVHMGYHYPRSVSTAIRSKENYDRFLQDWNFAINKSKTSLYCLSNTNTKTNSKSYEKFLNISSLDFEDTTKKYKDKFLINNIEKIYKVREDTFNIDSINLFFDEYLFSSNIDIIYNTEIIGTEKQGDQWVLKTHNVNYNATYIFNCSYSSLDKFDSEIKEKKLLKHEIAEIVFVHLPTKFVDYNVTVMDGPFFSLMYSPVNGHHTLSHVRYTPHFELKSDKNLLDPYLVLESYDKRTNFDIMKLDVIKFLPELVDMEYIDSFFEIKTVLNSSEVNDSREILIKKNKNFISILGSKIDQIYDVFEYIENEIL